MKIWCITACIFLFLWGTPATAEQDRTGSIESPASKEDLQKVTSSMRHELSRIERKSSETFKKTEEAARKTQQELSREVERSRLRIQLDIQKQAREARAEAVREAALFRRELYIATSVILGILLTGFCILYFHGGGTILTSKVLSDIVADNPRRFHITEKTDIAALRRYVDENPTLSFLFIQNGKVEIPCILELPRKGTMLDGIRFNCTVLLGHDSSETTVQFNDEPTLGSTWKNRISRAVEIAKKKTPTA